jgi:predicted O-methyltransferase YrrM
MTADVHTRAAAILRELEERAVIAENDRITALEPAKALYLFELALMRKPARVLEIGLGWGFSAAGLQRVDCVKRHVIVECDAGSARAIQGEQNVRTIAAQPQSLEFCWGDSHVVLPRLCASGENFDLVFIDGGHRFDDVFVDFHYSRRLVAPDACIVLDDTHLPAIRTAVSWIETNLADQWRRIPAPANAGLAAFEALPAADARRWDHFVPFVAG